jgi:hypothetical protein
MDIRPRTLGSDFSIEVAPHKPAAAHRSQTPSLARTPDL